MLSRNQARILKKIKLIKGARFNFRSCPDVHRCTIELKKDKFSILDKPLESSNRILFILESPHCDEYKNKKSIAPALGKTGENFNNVLLDALVLAQYKHSMFSDGIYEVWLVNAVQYQTSLGVKTKHYRSIIFQAAWHEFGESDFINRITNLSKNKKVIIFNACTIGNDVDTNTKNIVDELPLVKSKTTDIKLSHINLSDLIKESLANEYTCYQTAHPYRWLTIVS